MYLGELNDRPKISIAEMKSLARITQLHRDWENFPENCDGGKFRPDGYEAESEANIEPASKAWVKLVKGNWFKRKWIIQEAVFSKKKTCLLGPETYPWSLIEGEDDVETFTWISVAGSRMPESTRIAREGKRLLEGYNRYPGFLIKMASRHDTGKKKTSLLQLLKLSRFFDASDDRDITYALRGLVHDAEDFPKPDYTTNMDQL